MKTIQSDSFNTIEIRVGTIIQAELFAEARKPAYKLKIDFGELGYRNSSAQITKRYKPHELIGKKIVAVVNLPPKQIAGFTSECLVLGAVYNDDVILLTTDTLVANGLRIQ